MGVQYARYEKMARVRCAVCKIGGDGLKWVFSAVKMRRWVCSLQEGDGQRWVFSVQEMRRCLEIGVHCARVEEMTGESLVKL